MKKTTPIEYIESYYSEKESKRIKKYSYNELMKIKKRMDEYMHGKPKLCTTLSSYDILVKNINASKYVNGVDINQTTFRSIYYFDAGIDVSKIDKDAPRFKKYFSKVNPIQLFLESKVSIEEQNTTVFEVGEWVPNTESTLYPKGADFVELPLKGQKFNKLDCDILSDSSYYRFGIKFIGGETFGDDKIESLDRNILIHTGLGSMTDRKRDDLFTALFINGDRALKDGVRSRDKFTAIPITGGESYRLTVYVDENLVVHFSINDKEFESALAEKKILSKVYLFSWADKENYNIKIKNIILETKD